MPSRRVIRRAKRKIASLIKKHMPPAMRAIRDQTDWAERVFDRLFNDSLVGKLCDYPDLEQIIIDAFADASKVAVYSKFHTFTDSILRATGEVDGVPALLLEEEDSAMQRQILRGLIESELGEPISTPAPTNRAVRLQPALSDPAQFGYAEGAPIASDAHRHLDYLRWRINRINNNRYELRIEPPPPDPDDHSEVE